jgi:hypothetical protein
VSKRKPVRYVVLPNGWRVAFENDPVTSEPGVFYLSDVLEACAQDKGGKRGR